MKIFKIVALEQWLVTDKLTFAFPIDERLAYYKSELLREVLDIEKGLIMRIANPLDTEKPAFTVFRATAVPMPPPENEKAIRCKLEALYLAISENNRHTAVVEEWAAQTGGGGPYVIR